MTVNDMSKMKNTVNWDLPVTRNALQRRKPHSMYNKLFTRILDSSIWLEPTPTRIVWLTMIAAMDEDGFAQFASVSNVAHRAVVSLEEAQEAIKCLEGPDPNSSNPDNEGRRIERVDGGWMVINAPVYRSMATRIVIKEQTRDRVRKFREAKGCNAPVTQGNESVTPSETDSDSKAETKKTIVPVSDNSSGKIEIPTELSSIPEFPEVWKDFQAHRKGLKKPLTDQGKKLLLTTLSKHPEKACFGLNWAMEKSWTGFKWEWLNGHSPVTRKTPYNAASEYASEIQSEGGLI